jgi:hypothetical protein
MANLFWTHPNGDQMGNVPCIHFVQEHPGGDTVRIGPATTVVPCRHWRQAHPNGDPGPLAPCAHPVDPVELAPGYGVVFYTRDATIRRATFDGIDALRNLGVVWGPFQRPLSIFSRNKLDPNASSVDDPFRSHYAASGHAIQILPSAPFKRQSLLHELGHALIGQGCPRITGKGGKHRMFDETRPGTALSEGWAHFVALAIENHRAANRLEYRGITEWERRRREVPKSTKIEYNVATALWDLYDTAPTADMRGRTEEEAAFSFKELFGVFSPTLQTLLNGPEIPNVDDYLKRLKNNHPDRTERVDQVRDMHLA